MEIFILNGTQMIPNIYELFYIQPSPIEYITVDCIVNIEWQDEERKMEVRIEYYEEQDDNNDCSN